MSSFASTALTARELAITKKWADGAPASRSSPTCSTAQASPMSRACSGVASISSASAAGISQWKVRGIDVSWWALGEDPQSRDDRHIDSLSPTLVDE